MKYGLLTICVLISAIVIWRICGDTAGQPPLLINDMSGPLLHTRSPHPAGTVPLNGEPTAPTGTGAELFAVHCAHCHGNSGDGQSYISRYPGMPAVGNLQTSERPQPELHQIISDGRGAMPAFRQRLRDADRLEILNHLRTLQP